MKLGSRFFMMILVWAVLLMGFQSSIGLVNAAEIGMVTGRKYVATDSATPLTKRQLQDMKNMGANTIRIEFEDAQGAWGDRVQAYKNILQWATELNMKVIGLLAQSATRNPGFNPGHTRDKADFETNYLPLYLDAVRWHESTYGSYTSLEGWEIFNEPDVPNHGWYRNGQFMADEFALTNVRVWEWVKPQLNPSRKVIMGAMSHTDSRRWLEVYNTDTMHWFRNANNGDIPADILAMHGYGQRPDPRVTDYSVYGGNFERQLTRFFNEYRDRANRPLVPAHKSIYVTELGIDSKQANLDVVAAGMRFYYETMNKYPQIKKGFWYCYRDDETTPGFDLGGQAYGIRYIAKQNNGGIKGQVYNMMRNLVGRAGVGQKSIFGTTDQKFVTAFNRQDTSENRLGYPGLFNPYVHLWEDGVYVQDFEGGAYGTGKSMITLRPGDQYAGVIYGGFYDWWMANGAGPQLGYPFDNGGGPDQHRWDYGTTYQGWVQDLIKANGQKAMIQFEITPGAPNSRTIRYVSGNIYNKYMTGGGVSKYGYARSDRYWDGSRWKQDFAGGTIYE